MSDLVIVESPAKAKTIKKYLGKNYEVVASMGHIRDLPKSRLGVDLENGEFTPEYISIKGKGPIIKELKSAAKKSDKVYLATDPDREGEAISWHLAHILKLDVNDLNRVTFNEITKSGIKEGMKNKRAIDLKLVDAQQARRVLDRIVGYQISPFLWKKIRRGLSAGRVQSVVVKLICDREDEINAFVSEEYWSVDAKFSKKGERKQFASKLALKNGEKLKLGSKEETDKVLAELEGKEFVLETIKKGKRKKSPAPPFITSSLQQEASRKLGFQAKRTMKAAQELYEGVDLEGVGAVGLITYMRTDSLRISDEAKAEASKYIEEKLGADYLPPSPRVYKSKNNAQDAHEAIRPTSVMYVPSKIKSSLSSDQYKLYKLIWERFVASQMADAVYDTVSADIKAGDYTFKSTGASIVFDGFTAVYEEGKDQADEKMSQIPPLEQGDIISPKEILGNQHFTQPPARYTEASLIKTLEENGIGRPSTYAPTITTVLQRGYIEREAKSLVPTELGVITLKLIEEHFSSIVDAKFTAKMEDGLDKVEAGEENWTELIGEFYKSFKKDLDEAEKVLDGTKIDVPDEVTDVVCELCGRNMVVKMGRYGKFLACPGFPECKNTKKIEVHTPGICPVCGGKINAKKTRKGKTYYGCENNPKCEFMTWDTPLEEKCPSCGSSLFKKSGKNGAIHCLKDGCGYERDGKKKEE